MLGTGLRVGELTGLRWEDIDFQNNLLKLESLESRLSTVTLGFPA